MRISAYPAVGTLMLVAALALTACKREAPLEDVDANNIVEMPADETPLNQAIAEPAPPPANVVEPTPDAPPPKVAEDAQMRDDADATGLTSRLPEEDGSSNETQPVK